jgi:glycosyltransferase involved in cell wall biosynthesis
VLGRPLHHQIAPPGRDRLGALPEAAVVARARHARPLRVVSVGNLEPRKNLETLIAALARLPRGAWRLTICGGTVSSRYAARLRRLVTSHGLEEVVRFTGPVSNAELARFLANADVFAQPSWHEGFGIAALEAMGFGIPPIVSEAGGAKELVVDAENGFLVAPDDVSAVTRAVSALLNPDRRTAMSLAALDRYNRHPTWRESMERARTFLAALL